MLRYNDEETNASEHESSWILIKVSKVTARDLLNSDYGKCRNS